MTFPITGTTALVLAVVFGFAFGWLLHRGRVTDYNVIVNQFRFLDFTVAKVMLTAIVVGGVGVLVLTQAGFAKYHIKDANMLGIIIGAAMFGVGMVVYGYCPGTGLAAIGTGSLHALFGAFGMILGAIAYALTFDWVNENILKVWALGKLRLTDVAGWSDGVLYAALAVVAVALLALIETTSRGHRDNQSS
jgi:uncharacterized protein